MSHQRRPSHPPSSSSPDLQGAPTLANFLAQRGPPPFRESSNSHEFAPRAPRTSHAYSQRNAMPQGQNYPANYSREFGSADASRHPSLSLDTRNLAPPSGRSPSPVSAPAPLQTDLSTLKSGLESLWTQSARSLHSLHNALAAERDAHMRTVREREMLVASNAAIWKDKLRLESERRELRAKLDAQAAVAEARERAAESGSGNFRVKMEEDADDDENVTIPMREVQRMIEGRLQNQADEFARETTELYSRLTVAQRRTAELEAHLARTRQFPSPAPASAPNRAPPNPLSPVTPHTGQPSSHSDREFPFVRRTSGSGSGPRDMGAPDGRVQSNGVGAPHIPGPSYPAPGGSHSGTPLEDSRAYVALRPRAQGMPRDAYSHRQSHSHSHPHPQHDNTLQRTLSLPTGSPPMKGLSRRTASGSTPTAAPPQHVLPPAPYLQRPNFRNHPFSQQQQYPGPHSQHPGQQGPGSNGPPPPAHVSHPSRAPPPSSQVPPPTSSHAPHRSSSRVPPPASNLPNAAPPASHPPPPPPSHPPPPPSHPPPPPTNPPPPPSHPPPPPPPPSHPPPPPPHTSPPTSQRPLPQPQSYYPYFPPPQNHNIPNHLPPVPPPSGPARTSSYTAPPPPPPSHPPPDAPAPAPASSSPTQPKDPITHSRPTTPTSRPPKRARTDEGDAVRVKEHVQAEQQLTSDQKRTLNALGDILTGKRDGAGWKCVLCRQEKKSPTATFSEATPISAVTDHVRGVHLAFWEALPSPPATPS